MTEAADLVDVRALVFDIFGTVVDWRRSITRDVRASCESHGLGVDAAAVADAWRAGYQPAMDRVRQGAVAWAPIDELHRGILEVLIPRFGLQSLSEAERDHLNLAWHRLDPWPDCAAGLRRLRRRFVCGTLSNGNVSLLVDLARHGGLVWDCVLSAELFRAYKPDPGVYEGAAALLGLPAAQVMMVAAHNADLRAAAATGMPTAFVRRTTEHGPDQRHDLEAEAFVDVSASDLEDLADQLLT
jgi:2-haloacid dehalogenase